MLGFTGGVKGQQPSKALYTQLTSWPTIQKAISGAGVSDAADGVIGAVGDVGGVVIGVVSQALASTRERALDANRNGFQDDLVVVAEQIEVVFVWNHGANTSLQVC